MTGAQPIPSQPNQAKTPAEVDRRYQNALQEDYNQLQSQNVLTQSQMSPAEILSRINWLNAWQTHFHVYDPVAQWLAVAGLPQMAARLSQIQNDLSNALNVYNQMYGDSLKQQTTLEAIQRNAATDYTAMLLATTQRTSDVFQRSFDRQNLINSGYPFWLADAVTGL